MVKLKAGRWERATRQSMGKKSPGRVDSLPKGYEARINVVCLRTWKVKVSGMLRLIRRSKISSERYTLSISQQSTTIPV